jgi:uncharacterized protein (TIGR03435 family)
MTIRIAGKLLLGAGLTMGFIGGPWVRAQERPHPAFETASVKPNRTNDKRNVRMQFLPGGRVSIQGVPLQMVVAAAYDLPFQSPRLRGGTEWQKAMAESYDIEGVPESGAFPPGLSSKSRDEKVRLMLQSLLRDRFKMRMRIDHNEQPVYGLAVDKGGPKLQPSKTLEKDCVDEPTGSQPRCHALNGGQGRGLHGDAVTIADVVNFVQNWTDKPLVDKTGLTGLYNIQTEGWLPMRPRPLGPDGVATTGGDAGIYDSDRQTLFDVFRQLGLKMEPQRAVIDTYFVEHVEQPTAN